MIKEYSLKRDGELFLSKNFKVKEFACRDGSDKILIDTDLVDKIQRLRDYTGMPITIISGYRTETYNEKCGGARNSYHVKGMAVDIYCSGVKPMILALWSEFNDLGGVGIYLDRNQEFVHVDTRPNKYRWVNRNNTNQQINNIMDLL